MSARGESGRESPLQEELRREIEKEIETALAHARKAGEDLVADARRRRERLEGEAAARLEEELVLRRRRALARAELDGRIALLRLRQEETERVFRAAGEQLARMAAEDAEGYRALLQRIFRACRTLLPPGAVRVRIGAGGEEMAERLGKEEGVETVLAPDLRGISVESADGRQRCDGTLEALLDRLRQTQGAEIEELLFGEENEREE